MTTEGTTLRTLLSKVLNCDPMRITKKYTGNSSIGKRTFVPLVRTPENAIFMDMSQQDLRELRAVWVNKLILMEQWNNRKMNLMKGINTDFSHFVFVGTYCTSARDRMSTDPSHVVCCHFLAAHMGIGSMYDPTVSGGASNALFGGMGTSNTLFASNAAYAAHFNSMAGQSNSTLSSGSGAGQGQLPAPPIQSGSIGALSVEDKTSAASTETSSAPQPDSSSQSKEVFQEVALRLVLEPYVSTSAEMDFIIKWLKTLFYVLVDRTLSAADLEHSLYVGSISLPALVAIQRSRCIYNNPRLQQVHNAIVTYLQTIGITFPSQDTSVQARNSPLLPTSSVTAPIVLSAGSTASVVSAIVRPASLESVGTACSTGEMSIGDAPAIESKQGEVPSPTHDIDMLADCAAASTEETELAGKRKRTVTENTEDLAARKDRSGSMTTSPSAASTVNMQVVASSSPAKRPSPPPADMLLPPSVVLSSQGGNTAGFPTIPAHLRAFFATQPSMVNGNDAQGTSLPSVEDMSAVSAVLAANGAGAGFTVDPRIVARYQAELQAVAFSEQLTRAKAQAEAQAQALAESYHSRHLGNNSRSEAGSLPTVSSLTASQNALYRGGGSAGSGNSSDGYGGALKMAAAQDEESERVADADDHLMQYHKALVQSLAAERALKKTAAATARNIAAARGLPRPYQQSASHGYSTQAQPAIKRRKITEFNESYMRAAYNQQQSTQPQAGHPYQMPQPLSGQALQYQPGPESSQDSRNENRRAEEQDRVTPTAHLHSQQGNYNPRMGEGYHYNHALGQSVLARSIEAPAVPMSVTDPDSISSKQTAEVKGASPPFVGDNGPGSAISSASSGGMSAADYDRAAQSMAAMSMLYENSLMKPGQRRGGGQQQQQYGFPPAVPTLPSVASQMTPEIFSQFLHSYYAWPYGTPPIHMMPPPQSAQVEAAAQRQGHDQIAPEWPGSPQKNAGSNAALAAMSKVRSEADLAALSAMNAMAASNAGAAGAGSKLTLEDCLKMMQRGAPPSSYPGVPSDVHAQNQSLQPMPRYYQPPPYGVDPAYGAYSGYPYPSAHNASLLGYPPYTNIYSVPGIPASLLTTGDNSSNSAMPAKGSENSVGGGMMYSEAALAVEAERNARAESEEAKRVEQDKEQGHSAAAEALLNLFNK